MKRVVHYKPSEARDFFERLATYSAAYVQIATPGVRWPTPNKYNTWKDPKGPTGHILHHTAGISFAGTIRYFTMNRTASSNWVIARGLDHRFDPLRKDLELDTILRADGVQVVPPEFPSWHAGWVNRFALGTECRNAGILRPWRKGRKPPAVEMMPQAEFFELPTRRREESSLAKTPIEELDFYWWGNSWTAPFTGDVQRVVTPSGAVCFWESYSRGQVATLISILRYAASLYPLERPWMLAHHQVKPTKTDIVLPLDINAIYNAVFFSEEHVDDLEFLADLPDDTSGFVDRDDAAERDEMSRRSADRAEDDEDDVSPYALDDLVDTRDEAIEALSRLHFHVVDNASMKLSTWIYQRGRGLKPDGIAGPVTMRALTEDVRKWRLSD